MSKIGNYYLELQEQANELGFDTVEEAFDAGYEVHMGKLRQCGDYMNGGKTEIEQAHEAWLKRKDAVVGDLRNLLLSMHTAGKSDTTEYNVISDTLTFILEGEQ